MMKVSLRLDYRLFKIWVIYPPCFLNFFIMNERIADFISQQRVATVCCVDEENKPHCFSCFYAFDNERQLLYFKSGSSAHHSQILLQNPVVAGAIQQDKVNSLAIKGIQFTGKILHPKNELCSQAESVYHKRFPFALAMPGEIWTLQPETVKMTDNTLSFGKKLHWSLHEVV
jgi:uncharacterized protein